MGLPISCGEPDEVSHAEPSSHSNVVFPQNVTYNVDPGYSLNGRATGSRSFERHCHFDGQLTPAPTITATTADNKYFGIRGGRSIAVNIVNFGVNLSIGEGVNIDSYDWLIQEVIQAV